MDFSNKTTAYELLLEANRLYSEKQTEEAVRMYREVLKHNPTPAQRQIAEDQLSLLGYRPTTASVVGNVIRRPPSGSMKQRSIRPMAPLFPEKVEVSRIGGGSRSQGTNKKPWAPTSSSRFPLSRTEKLRSQAENMFSPRTTVSETLPPTMPTMMTSDDTNTAVWSKRQEIVTPLPRAVCTQIPVIGASLVASASSLSRMDEPRRKGESEKEYEERVRRYSIWDEKRKLYPDIDLNTALRLAEKGWTLEELRLYQQKRKNRYMERRQKFYQEKRQHNRSFSGTQYWETLIFERIPLRVYGTGADVHDGILVSNDLYHWCLENPQGSRCAIPKLQLELVCEKELLGPILSMCRLDQEQRARGEVIPVKPDERFHIPDRVLMHSLEQESPLLFQTYGGVMCWGWVFWYDPYQLSVVLLEDQQGKTENNEMIEVMLFRHAIHSMQETLPLHWDSCPRLGD